MKNLFLKTFFIKALPVSSLLFLGVLAYFHSLSQRPSVNESTVHEPEHAVVADINQATATIQCLHQGLTTNRTMTMANCENTNLLKPSIRPEPKINTNGQTIVFFIYFLQWLCLNCQISLFFIAQNEKLDPTYSYLADWSINASPMLGVLGTIASFAFLLADSGTSGLAALFNVYFLNAATTTIMGGIVYVICLLLMVWIGPAIEQ
ncbi:hypothetical protein TI03_02985 [Achromatium sp. WMS1]|nr:hypothetical protein TI03_02985 [Achromatium sp. WMS1]